MSNVKPLLKRLQFVSHCPTYQYGLVVSLQRSFHLFLRVQPVALPPQPAGLVQAREPLCEQVTEDHIHPVTLHVGHPRAVPALLTHRRPLLLLPLPLQTLLTEAVSAGQSHGLEQKAQTHPAAEVLVPATCSSSAGPRRHLSSPRAAALTLAPVLPPDAPRQVLYEVGQVNGSQSLYLRRLAVHIESLCEFTPEGERISPLYHQLLPVPRISDTH